MKPEETLQPDCYKRHAEIENHITEGKGWRIAIIGILVTLMTQVGAFLFMWGGVTNTVNKNSDYIWGELTSMTKENTRNLDRLMAKLEDVKVIAIKDKVVAVIEDKK